MWHQLRDIETDFVKTANKCFVVEVETELDIEVLWEAFADSANWKHWFPGVKDSGYSSESPYGVGAQRFSHVGRSHYKQTILEWDKPYCWSYRIDQTTLPLAYAQFERTEFRKKENGSLVIWTLAADPRLLLRIASPFMERTMKNILQQALENLSSYLANK